MLVFLTLSLGYKGGDSCPVLAGPQLSPRHLLQKVILVWLDVDLRTVESVIEEAIDSLDNSRLDNDCRCIMGKHTSRSRLQSSFFLMEKTLKSDFAASSDTALRSASVSTFV